MEIGLGLTLRLFPAFVNISIVWRAASERERERRPPKFVIGTNGLRRSNLSNPFRRRRLSIVGRAEKKERRIDGRKTRNLEGGMGERCQFFSSPNPVSFSSPSFLRPKSCLCAECGHARRVVVVGGF